MNNSVVGPSQPVARECRARCFVVSNPSRRGRPPITADTGEATALPEIGLTISASRDPAFEKRYQGAVIRSALMSGGSAVTIVQVTAQNRAAFISAFVQKWVTFDAYCKLTDPTWTYRMFRWNVYLSVNDPEITCFAAVAGTSVEGLLCIQRKRGATNLAIKFLSAAPWNYGPSKRLRGIGTGLLVHAVQVCRAGGFAGCELSATPEAETFYERMDWTRTGNRDREGLAVFELGPTMIDGFLAKHPPFPTK